MQGQRHFTMGAAGAGAWAITGKLVSHALELHFGGDASAKAHTIWQAGQQAAGRDAMQTQLCVAHTSIGARPCSTVARTVGKWVHADARMRCALATFARQYNRRSKVDRIKVFVEHGAVHQLYCGLMHMIHMITQ
jgi:hypothetical protein